MALSYTNVFGDLGKLIARLNSYATLGGTTLPADLLVLLTQFGTRWLPPEGIASYYAGLQGNVASWRQGVAAFADRRLLDNDTVLTPLGLSPSAGLDAVLAALQKQMTLDGQTVKACSCTLGAMTPAAGNAGNGQAWATLVMDGFNPPVLGALASYLYAGVQSQLCVPSETMTLSCIADSILDGTSEGAEAWSWTGGPQYPDLDTRAEGSGAGPGVSTAHGQDLLSNGSLEDWSSSVPVGWTLATGTLVEDTTTFLRGGSSARFTGDGSTVLLMSQPVSPGVLQGKRRYHVGLAMRSDGTPAPATLRVYFSGTGYAVTGESLSVPGGSFPGAWTLYSFFLNTPAPIPADWALNVSIDGVPAGVNVWFDSLSLAPAVYHGGVGLAITSGSSPWQRGDRLTFSVANNGAGLFQSFFRRHYLVQLPSVNTASIAELLAAPFLLMPWAATEGIADSQVA